MGFEVRIYSREGTSTRQCDSTDVHETLRQIGLEWKQSDWAYDQTVVILVAPVIADEAADLKARLRAAQEALEG